MYLKNRMIFDDNYIIIMYISVSNVIILITYVFNRFSNNKKSSLEKFKVKKIRRYYLFLNHLKK